MNDETNYELSRDDEKLSRLLSGELEPAERERLRREYEQDPALANELRFMDALSQGLRDSAEQPPGEIGLARLKRGINRLPATDTGTLATAAPAKPRNLWRPLAVAACALLGLQTAMLIGTWQSDPQTLDLVPLATDWQVAPAQLQLVFSGDATEVEIRAALLTVDGRIVDGPGALGVYAVALPADLEPAVAAEQLAELAVVEQVVVLE